MRISTVFVGAILCLLAAAAHPQQDAPAPAPADEGIPADPAAVPLPKVEIVDKPWKFNSETRYSHLQPEVDGTQITVTKKNTVVKLDEQPTILDNNQRQVFERMPGLVISEQQNPGQVNINYRGIGGNGALGTQESELLLSLQDGVPVASNWIGFPTQYYLPVPQAIGAIQFVRGASGLLYGPEPAALNYISRGPAADTALEGYSEHVAGGNGLYSTFNRLSGTMGAWEYLANAHYRKSDGERANGDYALANGDIHAALALGEGQKLGFDLHAYDADTGEAGRMSLAQWRADPHQTTTPHDHDWVKRYTGVVTFDDEVDPDLLWQTKAWYGYHNQTERNAIGNNPVTCPAPNSCVQLVNQAFHYAGLDTRARLKWSRGNAMTAGFVYYDSVDPQERFVSQDLDAPRDDYSGTPILNQQRRTRYAALFAENVFRFGRWHVVPSARVEREVLSIAEPLPPIATAGTTPAPGTSRGAIDRDFTRTVPLFGLGFGNDFGHGNETYVSIAQGYRPTRYLDVAPTSAATSPTGNEPEPSKSLTYEAGVHGWPVTGLYYDVSVFQAVYTNRVESQGVSPNQVNVNTGDTRHRGAEALLDYDVLPLLAAGTGGAHLNAFVNAMYLDAEFTETRAPGVAAGNDPSYAPHYVIREGLLLRRDHAYKLSLSAAHTGSQYWQDSNAAAGGIAKIPAYVVADLAADWWVLPHLRVLGGVSNLLDRQYYSRVLFGGSIEPGLGRNVYAGISAEF